MSGNRRKIAHKPYNSVKHQDLEERIQEYDAEVAKAFKVRFDEHDRQIREDLDEQFADQNASVLTKLRVFEDELRDRLMTFLYVVVGGTAAALAVAIVALVLALT